MSEITAPSWKEKELEIAKEKRIYRMLLYWEAAEPTPLPFTISLDMGYRCFVYPPTDASEDDMHRFLAWFVRRSGKKFLRVIRDEGSILWWNHGGSTFHFENANFEALFLLEKFRAGKKCHVVEETQIVKVKQLVCNDEAAA